MENVLYLYYVQINIICNFLNIHFMKIIELHRNIPPYYAFIWPLYFVNTLRIRLSVISLMILSQCFLTFILVLAKISSFVNKLPLSFIKHLLSGNDLIYSSNLALNNFTPQTNIPSSDKGDTWCHIQCLWHKKNLDVIYNKSKLMVFKTQSRPPL